MSTPVMDARMTLENTGFISNMNKARESAAKGMETFKAVTLGLTGLGTAFAAFRGVEGFTEGLKGAFEAGRELTVQARQMSTNVASVVQLRKAWTEAGISADGVGTAVYMLNKALGGVSEEGVPTATAFNKIGLSIADLKKQNPVEQFRAIIKGLNGLPDSAIRANTAAQIFGRGAKDLQAILNDPEGFEEAIKNSESYAKTMQRNSLAFEKVSKTMEAIQNKSKGFYAGIAAGIAPALQALLDFLNKIDLGAIGSSIGRGISVIMQAFQNGKLGQLLSLSLTVGFKDAVNNFAGLMSSVLEGLSGSLYLLFDSKFFEGVSTSFKGLAEKLGGFLLEAFEKPINALISAFNYVGDKLVARSSAASQRKIVANLDTQSSNAWKAANAAQDSGAPNADQLQQKAQNLTREYNKQMDVLSDFYKQANMSLSDYIDSHQQDTLTFGGQTTADISAQGQKDVDAGLNLMKGPAASVAQFLTDTVKSWKALPIFDNEAGKAQLTALINSLASGFKDTAGDSSKNSAAAGATNSNSYNIKSPQADDRARLGFFIGSSPSTPGLSEARRIAQATEDSRTLLRKISVHLGNGSTMSDTVAVYQ